MSTRCPAAIASGVPDYFIACSDKLLYVTMRYGFMLGEVAPRGRGVTAVSAEINPKTAVPWINSYP